MWPIAGSPHPLHPSPRRHPQPSRTQAASPGRIAAAIAISVGVTVALTIVVFVLGTVIGLRAFGHDSPPEPQSAEDLSGEGAGLWVLFMWAIIVFVVAPLLYVASILICIATLFPQGQRMRPRLVSLSIPAAVFVVSAVSSLTFDWL